MKVLTGADGFGSPLKDELVKHLQKRGIEVEDLDTDKYYGVAEQLAKRISESKDNSDTRGILVCGTGAGMSIIANKLPGVYAAACENVAAAKNSRSINNSNVLTLGAKITDVNLALDIVDAWLDTDFKAAAPANDEKGWGDEINQFLDNSMEEIPKIGKSPAISGPSCPLCILKKDVEYVAVDIMPGGSWQVVRQDLTSAFVRFAAGSIEPAHHHTFGHDIVVLSGQKRVDNLTAGVSSELGPGDYLYTPATQVHRVVYHTDTEFFIKWDGQCDILLDETLEEAKAALAKVS
eukprot:TRINITY_DN7496_c0_g1_i1.p1 TRINITY_DN7496_c0_g1~~TRINITY_DN7496_c0_g1_i1.p1  ORF type:complete len:292 (+),score=78.73 TRINITY_DN7496_c0_g1_i1:91-966(+)